MITVLGLVVAIMGTHMYQEKCKKDEEASRVALVQRREAIRHMTSRQLQENKDDPMVKAQIEEDRAKALQMIMDNNEAIINHYSRE